MIARESSRALEKDVGPRCDGLSDMWESKLKGTKDASGSVMRRGSSRRRGEEGEGLRGD